VALRPTLSGGLPFSNVRSWFLDLKDRLHFGSNICAKSSVKRTGTGKTDSIEISIN